MSSPTVALIIKRLGGTAAAARLCEVSSQAVSKWRREDKIPHARQKYLQVVRPDVFDDCHVPQQQPVAAELPARSDPDEPEQPELFGPELPGDRREGRDRRAIERRAEPGTSVPPSVSHQETYR